MNIEAFLNKHGIMTEIGPAIHKDQHGTLYTIVTAMGVKKEGELFPGFLTSRELAEDFYCDTLLKWLEGRRKIIWRHEPELIEEKGTLSTAPKLWQVYSRLTAYP